MISKMSHVNVLQVPLIVRIQSENRGHSISTCQIYDFLDSKGKAISLGLLRSNQQLCPLRACWPGHEFNSAHSHYTSIWDKQAWIVPSPTPGNMKPKAMSITKWPGRNNSFKWQQSISWQQKICKNRIQYCQATQDILRRLHQFEMFSV